MKDIARIYRRTVRLKKIDRGVSSLNKLKAVKSKRCRDGYCLSRGMVTRGVGVVGMVVRHRPIIGSLCHWRGSPMERIE